MKYNVGIEGGGTKFVVGLFDEKQQLVEQKIFPTLSPSETIDPIIEYLQNYQIESIGIGSFGPIIINKKNKDYGMISANIKQGWQGYNIVEAFENAFNIKVSLDTDVNTACLAEAKLGVAKQKNNVLYLTIGTGIGGGVLAEGKLVHGFNHSELGHVILSKHPDDTFEGNCPYHKTCFEGLAAGPAIEARWQVKGEALTKDHPAWDLEAYYIGQALCNFIMTLAPEMIILGGGVMQQDHLLEKVRKYTLEFVADYLKLPPMDEYIVKPQLFPESGLYGAMLIGVDEN